MNPSIFINFPYLFQENVRKSRWSTHGTSAKSFSRTSGVASGRSQRPLPLEIQWAPAEMQWGR
jgi:hypothetical protein